MAFLAASFSRMRDQNRQQVRRNRAGVLVTSKDAKIDL